MSFASYVALGDSMSIDAYPGPGLGGPSLLHRDRDDVHPAFAGTFRASGQSPGEVVARIARIVDEARRRLDPRLPGAQGREVARACRSPVRASAASARVTAKVGYAHVLFRAGAVRSWSSSGRVHCARAPRGAPAAVGQDHVVARKTFEATARFTARVGYAHVLFRAGAQGREVARARAEAPCVPPRPARG